MRGAWLFTVAAMLTATAALADPGAGALTTEDLARLRTQVISDTDQFSAPVDQTSYIGRAFIATIDRKETSKYWSYDRDSQTLIIDLRTDFIQSADCDLFGVTLRSETTSQEPKTGQTVGGAAINYMSYHVEDLSVGSENCALYAMTDTPRVGLQASIKMPGDEARTVTSGLRFVVSGTLKGSEKKKVVECSNDYSGATLDTPAELYIRRCTLVGTIDEIQAIDATGKTIAQWSSR